MQIAKDLTYFYSCIPWLAFCGKCTVNYYPNQGKSTLALKATIPLCPVIWPELKPPTPTFLPAFPQTPKDCHSLTSTTEGRWVAKSFLSQAQLSVSYVGTLTANILLWFSPVGVMAFNHHIKQPNEGVSCLTEEKTAWVICHRSTAQDQ